MDWITRAPNAWAVPPVSTHGLRRKHSILRGVACVSVEIKPSSACVFSKEASRVHCRCRIQDSAVPMTDDDLWFSPLLKTARTIPRESRSRRFAALITPSRPCSVTTGSGVWRRRSLATGSSSWATDSTQRLRQLHGRRSSSNLKPSSQAPADFVRSDYERRRESRELARTMLVTYRDLIARRPVPSNGANSLKWRLLLFV